MNTKKSASFIKCKHIIAKMSHMKHGTVTYKCIEQLFEKESKDDINELLVMFVDKLTELDQVPAQTFRQAIGIEDRAHLAIMNMGSRKGYEPYL